MYFNSNVFEYHKKTGGNIMTEDLKLILGDGTFSLKFEEDTVIKRDGEMSQESICNAILEEKILEYYQKEKR